MFAKDNHITRTIEVQFCIVPELSLNWSCIVLELKLLPNYKGYGMRYANTRILIVTRYLLLRCRNAFVVPSLCLRSDSVLRTIG